MLRAPRTIGDIARVGPIHSQAYRIHRFLSDERTTGAIAVTLPEEMPVSETLDLEERLTAEMDMGLGAVIVNALYPERFNREEGERIASLDGRGSPAAQAAVRAAVLEHERARAQRSQLRKLKRGTEAPVMSLPYLFEPELGVDELEALSRELERKLP
jgi:hypothetical protein